MDHHFSLRKLRLVWGALKRIRSFVPPASLHSVIYSLIVQPHFNYCNIVWGNCNIMLSNKLQKLQNKAARIMTSSSFNSNVDDLFVELGWRKLSTQRQMQKPGYLSDQKTNSYDVTIFSLRDQLSSVQVSQSHETEYILEQNSEQ